MAVLIGEEHVIDTFEEENVDEKDPTPTITLAQAKDMSEKLFAFVSENCALVKQAGTKLNADYVDMANTI
jgi:riboflavin synthase